VDTCMEVEDLQALKTAITQILGIMPETSYVGLISFGTMVHVHELGYPDCSKAYVFRGDKDINTQQVGGFSRFEA
jgi:protein transport protein SEC23